jgi:hypothetical protein
MADAATAEQSKRPQNGYQDDGSGDGDQQTADAEGGHGYTEQPAGDPAAYQSTDYADDDVGEAALFAVSVHYHRSDPAGQGAEQNPQNYIENHVTSFKFTDSIMTEVVY